MINLLRKYKTILTVAMKKKICLFEDAGTENFLPLTYTRPVYELLFGISTLREKIISYFPQSPIILHTRKFLEAHLKEMNPALSVNNFTGNEILFINGRLLINKTISDEIKKLTPNSSLVDSDGVILAACMSGDKIASLNNDTGDYIDFSGLDEKRIDLRTGNLLKYPWDLISSNEDEIENDFKRLTKLRRKSSPRRFSNVVFNNRKNIFISKNCSIDPFVYLDASTGPIYIDENVQIMSHCFIQGPAYIGKNSTVKNGAVIYHGTSIGEMCKVGGEIENSIIHSFSNKQHGGFLGHAYLGSWINFGADTNNSDLKNNYENISVLLNGKPVNTGLQFLGLIMGDHSKTAINTMFNTGTIVGVSCNIFGSGFPPRYIPSFSWGGSDFLRTYDLSKSLDVAKIVYGRRGKFFAETDEKVLTDVFEMTRNERGRKSGQ